MGHLGENGSVSTSTDEAPTTDAAQVKLPTGSRYSESELDRLLDNLTASADEWMGTVDQQANALVFLNKGWPYTTERQRERAWNLCKNRLTRLRFVKDEQGRVDEGGQRRTFERIMNLDNEPDVRLATAVHPSMYQSYQPEPEERAYEQVGGWLHLYMECVKHNQVPLAFHFWMGVLALSAAARRNVYVELGGSRAWLDRYIFLIGPKGSGKSNAMEYAQEVLVRMNNQLWEWDGRGTKVDRYEWQVNLLPEDATSEHIVNELEAIGQRKIRDDDLNETAEPVDATGLLLIDEMSVHYGQDSWGANAKIPFYTSISGRSRFTKGTVKRGRQTIENMLFSMAGCSAPEWMRDVVSPHVLMGGFVDRTLYIYRTFTHRCYDPLGRPIVDPLLMEDLAAQLVHWAKPPLGLKWPSQFTDSAKDWIRERYRADRMRELEALDGGHLMEERISLVRSSNQILKLATVLSMSERLFPMVDLSHLQIGLDLLTLEEQHFSDFMGEVRKTKKTDNLDRMKDYFRKRNWEMSRRDFNQKFKNIGWAKDLELYVKTMLESGDIMKENRDTDAGRSQVWYVWVGER